jgi:beta-N-acetylhexosaminidase
MNSPQSVCQPHFLAGFPGTEIPPQLVKAIQAGTVGGIILFRHNFTGDWRTLLRTLRTLADQYNLWLTLDQEGGRVQRLTSSHGCTDFLSAREIAAGTLEAAYDTYRTMARELVGAGFNLNLGPVVDLDVNPDCPIIGHYGRSYGRDPELVAAYAGAFIQAHRDEGLKTCLKHFPGHGSSREDSHLGFTDITTTWTPDELEPYRILISKGLADMVMIGHLFHRDVDPIYPATLSAAHLRVLRDDLGFQGPVMTDDMLMGAIINGYTRDEANQLALKAGCNLLVYRELKEIDEISGSVL